MAAASSKGRKTIFYCSNCGYESTKWMGQCPGCHEWNTFVEEPGGTGRTAQGQLRRKKTLARPVRLADVTAETNERTSTGFTELDRVLGGGIVTGSMMLIGGDPGIGKSTILLQVCKNLAGQGKTVLYISGEESLAQIRMRADRIGGQADSLYLLCETNLADIRQIIEEQKPDVCVIDSIQTMYNEEVSSAPGSVSQVRESTGVLLMLAKGLGISVFIVGHVTKEGAVAGPRVLEHMVDTVLYFEGDRHASYRILRGVKNRFGSTNEIGVFEMRSSGLVKVENPSEYMLSGRPVDASGSVVTCAVEGSRPLLLEIQALVARTGFGMPRRTAAGTDYNRVNLLAAVLEKRCGIDLSNYDTYVNIAGGIRMTEPALDLGITMAIASSYQDIVIPEKLVAFGEVGLSGEVRAVSQVENRVMEAKRLGFETVVLPKANMKSCKSIQGIRMIPVETVREAILIR